MAYMCADSGNLMAIAQQVIKQKEEQEKQQQQQPPPPPSLPAGTNPFYLSPWNGPSHTMSNALPPIGYGLSGVAFDPFQISCPSDANEPSFQLPPLDNPTIGFRFADFGGGTGAPGDFDSDEWMESLMVGGAGGDSTQSSNLASNCEVWHGSTDFSFCSAVDPAGSAAAMCSSRLGVTSSLSSHLSRACIFSENRKRVITTVPLPSASVPPRKEQELEIETVTKDKVPDNERSSPVTRALLECARLSELEPDKAVNSITQLRESVAKKQGNPTERVAFYFTEALDSRLSLSHSHSHSHSHSYSSEPSVVDPEDLTLPYKVFNDACPYSKFAHLTANQAILEAVNGAKTIHIIDFGVHQGIQWAALLQALASHSNEKPQRIRVSGIPALGGPSCRRPSSSSSSSSSASLSVTGDRLREFAKQLDLNFEFEAIVTPIEELDKSSFRVEPDEALIVNFMLQLYNLIDETHRAAASAVETVLRLARSLNPVIVTLTEYEVSLNGGDFMRRFETAVEYYSAIFESVEAGLERDSVERVQVESQLLGRRIMACIGMRTREERMECRGWWKAVMEGVGFQIVPVSHYAASQAKILLWNYERTSDYNLVDELPGFLTLAWKDTWILTVSSWR